MYLGQVKKEGRASVPPGVQSQLEHVAAAAHGKPAQPAYGAQLWKVAEPHPEEKGLFFLTFTQQKGFRNSYLLSAWQLHSTYVLAE